MSMTATVLTLLVFAPACSACGDTWHPLQDVAIKHEAAMQIISKIGQQLAVVCGNLVNTSLLLLRIPHCSGHNRV
jgi:hypothetical protein